MKIISVTLYIYTFPVCYKKIYGVINMQQITHYEGLPVQYTEIFKAVERMKIFSKDFFAIIFFFFFFTRNMDCGCSLEPPGRGGSNGYPRSVFWGGIGMPLHTSRYAPAYPSFAI